MKPLNHSRKARKPGVNMQITINDPDRPRRIMHPSELAMKIAADKRRVERKLEERELADELKEVWDD